MLLFLLLLLQLFMGLLKRTFALNRSHERMYACHHRRRATHRVRVTMLCVATVIINVRTVHHRTERAGQSIGPRMRVRACCAAGGSGGGVWRRETRTGGRGCV